jgi:hypothetical protein
MATSLAHSPADIIRYLLIAQGIGTLPTSNGLWPIFATTEPPTPDNCITVYNTTPDGYTRVMQGEVRPKYAFQVRVRAVDDQTGWLKANSIRELFTAISYALVNISSSVYRVQAIVGVGNILPIGKEPTSRREIFTQNSQVILRQIS